MRIDSHQHFWQYNSTEYGWISDSMKGLRRDFLPSHLEHELRLSRFHGSIAVQARQSMIETEWLLQLAKRYAFIKGVVGWIDLRAADAEQQVKNFSKNPRAVGIRHIIQDETDDKFMLREDFINGLHGLQKYDLAYDLLIYPKHLTAATQLVSQFPNLRFILDHLAKPRIKSMDLSPWKEQITELARFPNVWCKLSGLVTEADWQTWRYEDFIPYLETVLQVFGVKRVMIGSDWPVCTLAGSYQQVVSVVFHFIDGLSAAEQSDILGHNAVRAYKLKMERDPGKIQ